MSYRSNETFTFLSWDMKLSKLFNSSHVELSHVNFLESVLQLLVVEHQLVFICCHRCMRCCCLRRSSISARNSALLSTASTSRFFLRCFRIFVFLHLTLVIQSTSCVVWPTVSILFTATPMFDYD